MFFMYTIIVRYKERGYIMHKCPNCGAPMNNGSCGYCNYRIQEQQENSTGDIHINNISNINIELNKRNQCKNTLSEKDRMTVLILCIFFGFLGIHQFYVGNTVKGIIYLFTGGLFGIGIIIDIILILTGEFKGIR